MFYQRNNSPFGQRNMFSSRYQYQTLPYGYEGTQASGLIGKVMGLLAFSFMFAAIGSFVGLTTIHLTFGSYWIVAIAGLVVLIALNLLIQVSGLNGAALPVHVPGGPGSFASPQLLYAELPQYSGRSVLDDGDYRVRPGDVCLDDETRFYAHRGLSFLRGDPAAGRRYHQHFLP